MQQLAAQNPQLVQLINANQEDFYHLINTPPGPMPGMGAPGGGQAIQVTPEENADIERLTEMGFDRAIAAQVCRSWISWKHSGAHFERRPAQKHFLSVIPALVLSPGVFCVR
jgi:hypothetical protein